MHEHGPGVHIGPAVPGGAAVALPLPVLARAFPHLVAVDLDGDTVLSVGPALLPLYGDAGPVGRPAEEVLDLLSPAGPFRAADLSARPTEPVVLRLQHPAGTGPTLQGQLVVDEGARVAVFLGAPIGTDGSQETAVAVAPGGAPAPLADRLQAAQARAQRFADGELALAREIGTRHDHKLEALGRLSAGIAHEINTPIQFVGDNTRFLADAYSTMLELLLQYRACLSGGPGALPWEQRRDLMTRAEAAADIDYLAEEVPLAVQQSLEGIERVATLVRAMKAFSYKDNAEPGHADLNEALRSTLTVARNEIKYVADVVLDLDDIPTVLCHVGQPQPGLPQPARERRRRAAGPPRPGARSR